jgi:hypothetical protein
LKDAQLGPSRNPPAALRREGADVVVGSLSELLDPGLAG